MNKKITKDSYTQTKISHETMEAMFRKEKNDPDTVVGCVAEMKLTVLSEAGERVKLVRERVLMAMENEAIDFIRLCRIGRLEGGAVYRQIKEKVEEPDERVYTASVYEIDDTHHTKAVMNTLDQEE